jgi:hypothetical protein
MAHQLKNKRRNTAAWGPHTQRTRTKHATTRHGRQYVTCRAVDDLVRAHILRGVELRLGHTQQRRHVRDGVARVDADLVRSELTNEALRRRERDDGRRAVQLQVVAHDLRRYGVGNGSRRHHRLGRADVDSAVQCRHGQVTCPVSKIRACGYRYVLLRGFASRCAVQRRCVQRRCSVVLRFSVHGDETLARYCVVRDESNTIIAMT